jgi:hypothetical protein
LVIQGYLSQQNSREHQKICSKLILFLSKKLANSFLPHKKKVKKRTPHPPSKKKERKKVIKSILDTPRNA